MDPIADMIVQIKNAIMIKDNEINITYSKFKEEILNLLVQKGFLKNCQEKIIDDRKYLHIEVNYKSKTPAIRQIKRVSKPGLRVYSSFKDIPRPLQGLGTVIISTPNGIMDGVDAKKNRLGGELICIIY